MTGRVEGNPRTKPKAEPPPADERRRYPRYQVPVVVEVPALSDMPLMPEDIGAGGFQAIVPKKAEVGQEVECTIGIGPEMVREHAARVVWVRENDMDLSTWVVGLRILMSEEAREELDRALRDFGGNGA